MLESVKVGKILKTQPLNFSYNKLKSANVSKILKTQLEDDEFFKHIKWKIQLSDI